MSQKLNPSFVLLHSASVRAKFVHALVFALLRSLSQKSIIRPGDDAFSDLPFLA